jgi:PhoD related phosphatase
MIGGGDQIYNDSVRVKGPLKPWTDIGNPSKRRHFPFDNEMRKKCDEYYFQNYVRWYSTEPFAAANASIAQINIWDDHDIIDGFGSYSDRFMRCPVFRGIGGVSFKYYCLFQHHTAPPVSTFTTDAPQTMQATADGTAGADPRQLEKTYVYKRQADDPSWIVGKRPGPYVEERSRSLYMRLGKRIAFCGIDARTERTRKQVNYPDTYDLIFNRLEREFTEASGEIKHLILLLGVPIAYPRLAWLENILSSPLIAPIRLLNKRFGIAGDLFNKFDGQVDLLDDLDDHYTAKHHKTERRELIIRLQKLSEKFSVRITILGGDVHLAALGRFYSNPENAIDPEHDPRYMANIISSAITNKPPPKAVANLLAKRNKTHHLRDGNTDECLLKLFNEQPGGKMKSADINNCTMPSRNYACITEVPDEEAPRTNGNPPTVNGNLPETGHEGKARPTVYGHDGQKALHVGEEGAGTKHPAADGISTKSALPGGLNVSIKVEIDNHDREGHTQGYGLSSMIPISFTDV